MQSPIPYGRQHITDADIESVCAALKSDYLTQGPRIKQFEEAFAQYVGANYAVAVSNGTAALHLNALALGVQPGTKVITSPITFAATANCVKYCGGEVVFADIDPDTYLIDIQAVRKLLERAPQATFAGIIPVDFAGRPVDMEAFRQLADEHNLWIMEDACHAPGASFVDSTGHDQFCGNGVYADLAIFSFHPVKHIAAGEGGMITTNRLELYEKLLELRTHGITKNPAKYVNDISTAIGMSQLSPKGKTETNYPGWYMEMQELGFNYRLTDFQAALGMSQLTRADAGLVRRRQIAATYHDAFKNISQIRDRNIPSEFAQKHAPLQSFYHESVDPLSPLFENASHTEASDEQKTGKYRHAYHLYVIEVDKRLELYNHLQSRNIFAQIHYIPLHLMPYYQNQGHSLGDFPHAEKYYSRCISLPMFPTLSGNEQAYVIETIRDFFGK